MATRECSKCDQELTVSGWDKTNGFLNQCPSCGVWNGHAWSIRTLMFASIIFSYLSFFFTMRPLRALLAIGGAIGFVALTGKLATSGNYPSIETPWYIVVFFSPVVVNGILFVLHETKLDKPGGKTGEQPRTHA